MSRYYRYPPFNILDSHVSLCGSPDQVPELDLLGLGGQTLPVVAREDGDDVLVHTEVAVVSLDVLQPGVLPQYLTRRIMLRTRYLSDIH